MDHAEAGANLVSLTDESIERLAAALSASGRNSVPIDYQIWDAEQVAGYLSTSVSNFLQYLAPHPKFPRPIKIPNTKGQKMKSRWKAMDIITYADDCKDR